MSVALQVFGHKPEFWTDGNDDMMMMQNEKFRDHHNLLQLSLRTTCYGGFNPPVSFDVLNFNAGILLITASCCTRFFCSGSNAPDCRVVFCRFSRTLLCHVSMEAQLMSAPSCKAVHRKQLLRLFSQSWPHGATSWKVGVIRAHRLGTMNVSWQFIQQFLRYWVRT